jgi:predicted RNase H-like HicB family nuclease
VANKVLRIKIRGELSFTIKLFQEDKTWIAYTPVFDLSSCGATPEEAQRMIGEAITTFLAECIREGTLDEVLEELGWKKDLPSEEWVPPKVIDVEVPLPA